MAYRLNSWRLFWLLALAVSVVICLGLPHRDFHTARDTEYMVLRSVRASLPLFLVAFTASALAVLWPHPFTRWLLANRRYFGLAFALGMAWHLSFVAYFLSRFGNHINLRAELADVVGLVFLIAMTVTSFRPVSRHLSMRAWRALHKTGIYAIWLLVLYIYQGGARGQRDALHVVGVAVLLGACSLRVFARLRLRRARPGGTASGRIEPLGAAQRRP